MHRVVPDLDDDADERTPLDRPAGLGIDNCDEVVDLARVYRARTGVAGGSM